MVLRRLVSVIVGNGVSKGKRVLMKRREEFQERVRTRVYYENKEQHDSFEIFSGVRG